MKKLLICAGTFIITFILILTGLRPAQYDIAPGRTAPADIYAKREIVDKLTTEKRRAEAEADLKMKYDISDDLTREAKDALSAIIQRITAARVAPDSAPEDLPAGAAVCLSMSESEYTHFCSILMDTQNLLLEEGILKKADALSAASGKLRPELHYSHAEFAEKLLEITLVENKIFNPEKTEEARQNLRNSVEDVTYKANQIIVRRGDIISQAQYEVLLELGMVKSQANPIDFLSILGVFILLCAIFTLLYLYINRYLHICLENNSLLLLVAIIFILTLMMSSAGIADTVTPYLLPIIAGTALLAILLNIRFAILFNAIISLLCVLIFEGDVYCFAVLLLSGTLSTFIFTRRGVRRTLVFSAVLQFLANGLICFGIAVLEGVEIRAALLRGIYGLASGAISSILVIGTLPFWEYAFDVTTPYKLLDLANPEQKLLKKLLTEAPGTYHHSLMVGNLAEAACEVVGADALLARTGAYYHDVGKLKRPQYFKENQYAENPHDKISPARSASIIISHVKDGLDLAKQYRLPGAIRNIIASHHGDSLVAFFHHKATIENEGEVPKEKFCYNAPRPATKEEAIVLLADATEAAVRSLENKTEDTIREMVHKIVQGKLHDQQLSKSGLTLHDIALSEEAFIHLFCGYFHSRIQYPDTEKTEK